MNNQEIYNYIKENLFIEILEYKTKLKDVKSIILQIKNPISGISEQISECIIEEN